MNLATVRMPNRKNTSGPNPLIVIPHAQFRINLIATIHPVVGQIAICLGHKKGALGVKILLTA
jgi:hypothetical protein